MPDVIKAALEAALSATEYAISLAKAADERFHALTGAVDEFLHNQLLKLEATAELIRSKLGIVSAAGDDQQTAYGRLSHADREEVAAQVAGFTSGS